MNQISTLQMRDALICAANLIVENEPYLTQIDTIIGDGDHGEGMKTGFRALRELLEQSQYESMYELFRASGLELLRVMGGASGVIFGTLFIGGREVVRDKAYMDADDLILFFRQGCEAIQKRGKSRVGDKTMLDALAPAIEAMERRHQTTEDVGEILRAAAQGAEEGAEHSTQLMPKKGRAKNFREKGIGYPDPGAVSVSIIFSGMAQGVT